MSFVINPINIKVNDEEIHPFLPSHPSLVAIVAPRKSGKTTLLVNMLTRDDMFKKFFHEIHIWSPTIKLDRKWEKVTKFLPEEWVHENFRDDEFLELMNGIKDRIEGKDIVKKDEEEKKKILKNNPVLIRPEKTLKQRRLDGKERLEEYEKKLEERKKEKPKRILFVFDDAAAEKGLFSRSFQSPSVKAAFTSRHYGVSLWVVSQTYKAINTGFRNNIFHWVIFNVPNEKEGDRMAEELCGPLTTHQFRKMLNDVTAEPYQFLYVNFESPHRSDMFRKGFGPPIDISVYKKRKSVSPFPFGVFKYREDETEYEEDKKDVESQNIKFAKINSKDASQEGRRT